VWRNDGVHVSVDDWRAAARRRLPGPIWHYLEGGSGDERTLARNSAAFADYELLPRVLVDISRVQLRTRVLGAEISMPLFLSPTGMSRLFHHDREPAVARAAAKAGTYYSLSTVATTSLEDVARAADGPRLFQIYVFKDRGLTRELVARCKAAGYGALALTVDTPLAGNRERDRRTGMTIPPALGLHSLLSFALHPYWSLHFLLDRDFELKNVAHRAQSIAGRPVPLVEYISSQFDRTLTWKDAEWLAAEWGGPLAIKGIVHPEDVRHAADSGATAVMLSNHGGRQLDGVPAPIDCVAAARDAIGDRVELIVDGGIRRGADVLKALALGANACSIGRPYLYGLAAAGEAGVTAVLQKFREEIERDLALLGCADVAQLASRHVRALRAGHSFAAVANSGDGRSRGTG
jgi:L-lactate dehydrogenase (cytochrome)